MTPEYTKKFLESFTYSDKCWNWHKAKNKLGYGEFYAYSKTLRAHRVSYEMFKGLIPPGLVIDHLCRNTSCVNPAHLEAVTNLENIMRGEAPCAKSARKTHCQYGHPLSGDNLWLRVNNPRNKTVWRKCRKCALRMQHAYLKRKAEKENTHQK